MGKAWREVWKISRWKGASKKSELTFNSSLTFLKIRNQDRVNQRLRKTHLLPNAQNVNSTIKIYFSVFNQDICLSGLTQPKLSPSSFNCIQKATLNFRLAPWTCDWERSAVALRFLTFWGNYSYQNLKHLILYVKRPGRSIHTQSQ